MSKPEYLDGERCPFGSKADAEDAIFQACSIVGFQRQYTDALFAALGWDSVPAVKRYKTKLLEAYKAMSTPEQIAHNVDAMRKHGKTYVELLTKE